MPLQATSGAASYDAFGGGVPVVPNYIEEVFSTYLYTGNGSTQTITNGIDLSGKGGLTWIKSRSSGSEYHVLQDTVRGRGNVLSSNTSDQSFSSSAGESITTYNSTGFSLGTNRSATQAVNTNSATYVSWTFREQAKFFDVLTYTGNGTAGRTVAHNLGSVPGCIIVKRTDDADGWAVYHRSLGATKYIFLDQSNASGTYSGYWNNTEPTSSVFSLGNDAAVNASGATYVAYLFAHDAGGFGLTGTDNVISCGSYTGNGSTTGPVVTLGYEPQWIMLKNASATTDWVILDTMRGLVVGGTDRELNPNQSGAESGAVYITPTATGFQLNTTNGAYNASGNTFIYVAIRRGPMKVPTSGTSVFSAVSRTGTSANATVSASISPVDMVLETARDANFGTAPNAFDRLRGANRLLITSTTGAEVNTTSTPTLTGFDVQNGYTVGNDSGGYAINYSPYIFINWNFKRAPSFMDVVCYTGTYTNRTISHNLQAVPELMIIKQRSTSNAWSVYSATVGPTGVMYLNTTGAADTSAGRGAYWNSTNPTASVFSVGQDGDVNNSGDTYVNYLFATCAGVSKVFSYTGNGSSQTINCGFTGGARFVLIKRTDSTGDWYVWDTARGIVAGNDPHLSLNTTAAEVTSNDTIDTDSTGFVVNQVSATNVNVSSATYIGLAIA
jgi:hypothetical protein